MILVSLILQEFDKKMLHPSDVATLPWEILKCYLQQYYSCTLLITHVISLSSRSVADGVSRLVSQSKLVYWSSVDYKVKG